MAELSPAVAWLEERYEQMARIDPLLIESLCGVNTTRVMVELIDDHDPHCRCAGGDEDWDETPIWQGDVMRWWPKEAPPWLTS